MIKVMCVDDQVLLREALIFMLSKDPEIEAIDGGSDGYEAIDNCTKYRPDVILMDIRMPNLDGVKATERIKNLFPSTKVMILTTFEDRASIFKAIEYKADGYMVKDSKPEELILSVKGVCNNLFVMHSTVVSVVQDEITNNTSKAREATTTLSDYGLTAMELEIIRLMVDGKNNKEIAAALNFTEGTIKNKVSRMLGKLDLKDRTQMVVFAIKHSII